jgi:DNA ligase D-like protein (predicted ligase)/DNA ligase D-like protein (predicted polymerase)/DNA ligase D-like protein (predicted 3'-phosphoesterase)
MPRTSQLTEVGKRRLELSNLDKVLYPEDGIVKAEVIQYYLKIAPTILRHIKGRPLSLVRYPDGIHGETFFQKQRPEWAPAWIEYVTLGDETKSIDYMMASEQASLVWLANLACLELHQIHARAPYFDKPDYFVFDLDPPEDFNFEDVVEIALDLKEHAESYGYHPFVKTTGKKGLHIVVPIESNESFAEVFEAAKDLAQPFVEQRQQTATLHIRKDRRKGRVLIDIYRNRSSQTIVAPYSLRGAKGGTVSTPLDWSELTELSDPSVYNLRTVVQKVVTEGDAWEALPAFAVPLHTGRSSSGHKRTVTPSRTKKTPEQLKEYERKRSFDHTPEPAPGLLEGRGDAFVVHRHHASRLHYDLRLEHEGALRSWAVPRGLPERPGVMRLAVEVEDHPLEYLTFEGEIPKGQYGGGMMWIYALGRFEITKEKKNGFYFRLQSKEVNAEYRIHRTKGKEWLLERVDEPQVDWLNDEIEFMLPVLESEVPDRPGLWYELKWDGIRAMIVVDDGQIRIMSRNQRDITGQFPELLIPQEAFRATNGVFDGEIVCFDSDGKPDFKQVVNRLHHTAESTINRAATRHPAFCYLFDCLYLDGRAITRDPLARRRDWLVDIVKRDTPYRVSEVVDDGPAFFEAVRSMGMEGIVAKDPSSPYLSGKRSPHWVKIKVRETADCLIVGYTQGKGDRSGVFGALHIAQREGDDLVYRGKVGTGFTFQSMKSILSKLNKISEVERPIDIKPVDDAETTWIEPKLYCEVQYASITKNATFREPVFLRLRPDLSD